MLKGNTKIELFDSLTGKLKDVREEHNLVTNAMGKMYNFALAHNFFGGTGGQDAIPNVYTNYLGWCNGLMLFDSAITENANTFWCPAGVKPTAYGNTGSWDNQAGNTMIGNYISAAEEYVPGESIKRVWGFDENHGNGTIACACLTPLEGSLLGYGQSVDDPIYFNQTATAYGMGCVVTQTKEGLANLTTHGNNLYYGYILTNNEVGDFCIDSDNDIKYQFRLMSNKLQIITHRMSPDYFSVFNSTDATQNVTIDDYAGTFNAGNYVYWFYNTDEQILYFWQTIHDDMMVRANQSITIHKFDVVNKVLTAGWKTFTNDIATEANMPMAITSTAVYYVDSGISYSDSKHIRKYSFSTNSSTGISMIYPYGYRQRIYPYIINGMVVFPYVNLRYGTSSNTNNSVYVDTTDDTVRFSPLMSAYTYVTSRNLYPVIPPYNKNQLIFGCMAYAGNILQNARNSNVFVPMNYLATINNLSEPVVKTSALNMRVTYTLSVAEE